MDKWEDYPIKVLDIAPLSMVMLPMVSSFFSTCGCFLRDVRSSFGDLPPPEISSSRWCLLSPPLVGASFEMRMALSSWMVPPPGLKDWRSVGCKERGAEPTTEVGQAGLLGPNDPGPSRSSSVAPSLPWVLRWLCTLPLPFAWFWRCHPRVQDGGSPCMKFGLLRFNTQGFLHRTSVLATIGSDFIKLMNTKKTL
jgi:hypothetical protein